MTTHALNETCNHCDPAARYKLQPFMLARIIYITQEFCPHAKSEEELQNLLLAEIKASSITAPKKEEN